MTRRQEEDSAQIGSLLLDLDVRYKQMQTEIRILMEVDIRSGSFTFALMNTIKHVEVIRAQLANIEEISV